MYVKHIKCSTVPHKILNITNRIVNSISKQDSLVNPRFSYIFSMRKKIQMDSMFKKNNQKKKATHTKKVSLNIKTSTNTLGATNLF